MREKFLRIMRKLPIRVRASLVMAWIALFFWLPVPTALIVGILEFFDNAKEELRNGYSVLIEAAKGAYQCIKTGEELES
ncbi:TPA: hypothetical protein NOE79_005940 [Pseudomonas aeruginosa]|nr:hypothetical protein [Pseudomonas aeruginosa]